eukprot:CAMPEP_0167801560 /NCGR_PEP_ID=MMETSP0111_2-20121227/18511_1 /TAXON_ID=91324 /ORGANISM="Lotharella globosa, Strain CCCM811" /LENGTH=123 /DNA_ID=CAMNT_0007697257 /DNA_START=132 /DNA_END=503 /DNA_ORIENTATION=+
MSLGAPMMSYEETLFRSLPILNELSIVILQYVGIDEQSCCSFCVSPALRSKYTCDLQGFTARFCRQCKDRHEMQCVERHENLHCFGFIGKSSSAFYCRLKLRNERDAIFLSRVAGTPVYSVVN